MRFNFFVLLAICTKVILIFPILSKANSTVTPDIDPTTLTCDSYKLCPAQVFCDQGQCKCPGNGIYSLSRRQCKMRAGGMGCTASGHCTDGAHCYHWTERRRSYFTPYRWRWVRVRYTQCHCCEGQAFGVNGKCPSSDCVGSTATHYRAHIYTLLIAMISTCILNKLCF